MSASAKIFPIDPNITRFEKLSLVAPESAWRPAQFEAPDVVLDLYGKQLAVDFLSYAGHTYDEEGAAMLSKVVAAMPKEHGRVELAFLEHIAMGAICHAAVMPKEY